MNLGLTSGLTKSGGEKFVFVADADCLAHVGRVRGSINIPAFARLLKDRGVTDSLIISNWLSPIEEKLWEAFGARCKQVHTNADPFVASALLDFARNGVTRILLGSGDGGFADLVKDLRRQYIDVHVLASKTALSRDLRAAATDFAFCDRYVWLDPVKVATAARQAHRKMSSHSIN